MVAVATAGNTCECPLYYPAPIPTNCPSSRERLNGHWGEYDVLDCIHAMRALSAAPHPLIDARRSIIRGRSAGGYIALATACRDRKAFAAATSMYGAADLRALVQGMHKFQRHHVLRLVGGAPEAIPDVYERRTPLKNLGRIAKLGFPPLLVRFSLLSCGVCRVGD